MSKLNLNNFSTLQNSSIISSLNSNNVLIENAIENTLSRDGMNPNTMGSNLDMNNNQIINLPTPSTIYSPVRLIDIGVTPIVTSMAILDASTFSGATNGDKIVACIAALPSTGGICDARNLSVNGVIPSFTINKSGITILGPFGVQTITGIIKFNNVRNVRWYGCGEEPSTIGTRFSWAGNSTDPCFQLSGSRECVLADFSIWSSSLLPLSVGIGQSPQAGGLTTNNTFKNIIIESNNAGGLDKGMRWYGVGGNNDASLVERVTVNNYTTAAFSIEYQESQAHLFLHCQFNGTTGSLYGITTALGATPAGSFTAINTLGDHNSGADFYLGAPNAAINIIGGNLESSARLLMTTSATSTGWPVLVQGMRWSADSINPDNKAVIFHHRSGFTFINNIIEGGPVGVNPLISLQPSSTSTATAIGNVISWDSANSSSQPFVSTGGTGHWSLLANSVIDHGGSGVLFPITSQL